MTKELLMYHRQLEKKLDCPKSMRDQFLADARRMTDDFFAENPGTTLDELQSAIGEPDQLAAMFLESADHDAVDGYRKRKSRLKRSMAIFFVVVFIAVTAFSIYGAYFRHASVYTKKSTITIISTEEEIDNIRQET